MRIASLLASATENVYDAGLRARPRAVEQRVQLVQVLESRHIEFCEAGQIAGELTVAFDRLCR
jgi:hypothetical protein